MGKTKWFIKICMVVIGMSFSYQLVFACHATQRFNYSRDHAWTKGPVSSTTSKATTYTPALTTTSSTDCDAGEAESKVETEALLHNELERIAEEAAQGKGAYLEAVAQLMGCPAEDSKTFIQVTHKNFQKIFPSSIETKNHDAVLKNWRGILLKDERLSESCTSIS